MVFEDEILIPKARVAVLIGTKGATRKMLERVGKFKLRISSEGEVKIAAKDAELLLVARNIVEAIGRGFNPEIAKLLLKENFAFDLIDIMDYVRKDKDLPRIRGVLIGEKGKARRLIEDATKSHISIYGKTVAIVGPIESIVSAHRAIEMLLTGSRHATMYKFLGLKEE